MSFSDEEVAYLRSQRLGRLATVSPEGQPDVVPVGFEFDGTHLYVGGLDPARTRKFRNVRAGNTKVALVIDDLASVRPWSPRYLRIYGTAELVERPGQFGPGPYMRITPPSRGASILTDARSPTTARSSRAAPSTTPPIRREANPHPPRLWNEPIGVQRDAPHAPRGGPRPRRPHEL
jgi:pyridoxamine 5'-phosphate oxidase family protein